MNLHQVDEAARRADVDDVFARAINRINENWVYPRELAGRFDFLYNGGDPGVQRRLDRDAGLIVARLERQVMRLTYAALRPQDVPDLVLYLRRWEWDALRYVYNFYQLADMGFPAAEGALLTFRGWPVRIG